MTKTNIDQEMDAIKAVTQALEPLEVKARQRVLDYVTGHLGLEKTEPPPSSGEVPPTDLHQQQDKPVADIRSLKEEKQPTTDVQMATIVAYYLSKIAPENLRQDTIGSQDIENYFDQAGHPLPPRPDLTLNNARTAGYLDRAGRGKFKLNPVGHNLVVHNLPKSGDGNTPRRSRRKKKASKKSAKKKGKSGTSKKAV